MVFELRFNTESYDFPVQTPMGRLLEIPYDLRKRMVFIPFQNHSEYQRKVLHKIDRDKDWF